MTGDQFWIPRTATLKAKQEKNQRAADLARRRGGHEAAPRGAGGRAEAAGRHGELLVERHLVPGRRPRSAALAGVADVEAREQRAHHLPLLLPASSSSSCCCTSPRHPLRGEEPGRAVSVSQSVRQPAQSEWRRPRKPRAAAWATSFLRVRACDERARRSGAQLLPWRLLLESRGKSNQAGERGSGEDWEREGGSSVCGLVGLGVVLIWVPFPFPFDGVFWMPERREGRVWGPLREGEEWMLHRSAFA